MSKSLNAKVMSEINRREKARIKKEMEEKKAKNDAAKATIMNTLVDSLKECLEDLKRYHSHKITYYSGSSMPYKFEENAKELGFNLEFVPKVRSSDFAYYILSVPAFEKGNRRTPAQLRLYKFEQELSKKRRERKAQLLVECKRIKQEIEKGNFEYSTLFEKTIYVKIQETLKTDFEKEVVYNFFVKYGLIFNKNSSKFTLTVSENN